MILMPNLCQRHALGSAFKERDIKVFLQRAHMLSDSALRNAQLFGRTPEIQMPARSVKRP